MPDNRSFPDISFLETNTEALRDSLIAAYEHISGKTLAPASPERLFILWVTNIIAQQQTLINDTAKQNVPRYARGEKLDSLAELFRGVSRLPAQPATTTIRFYISETQPGAVLIPQGTRVTTADGNATYATTADAYVPIGSLYVDTSAVCTVAGEVGNGFVAGQLSTLVDLFPFYDHCENTTESEGGAPEEDDDAFYNRMRESEDTYSTAGSIGAYKYYARSVSGSISDVVVTTPDPGDVNVYVLMQGGELPGLELLAAVEAALSADDVRPLTDNVTALAPTAVTYNIDLTYYIPANSAIPANVIEAAVITAVDEYKAWQNERMGRDVNPSKLVAMLMETGVKRVALSAPVYAALTETQVAALGTENVVNGGFEDE